MALFKTKQAVKYEKKNLLGIQDLSIPEIVHILNESQSFVELNRKENKKLSLLKGKT
jgi:aspartate carbamoyltransferase catalytic subunit